MNIFPAFSFKACLECLSLGHNGPENPRAVNIAESAPFSTDNGWLTLEHDQAPMVFSFDYQTQTHDRVLVGISSASKGAWEGALLNSSRNGYLGMYWYRGEHEYWRIQPLGEWKPGAVLDFTLRTWEGREVGIIAGNYLSVGADTVAVFRATPED